MMFTCDVYVDRMMACVPNEKWKYAQNCHMFVMPPPPAGDGDIEVLHAMAERLGLKREYFQADGTIPHYDLTKSKRSLAIRFGAVQVNDIRIAVDAWRQARGKDVQHGS